MHTLNRQHGLRPDRRLPQATAGVHQDLLREPMPATDHITPAQSVEKLGVRGLKVDCLTTIGLALRQLGLSHKETA